MNKNIFVSLFTLLIIVIIFQGCSSNNKVKESSSTETNIIKHDRPVVQKIDIDTSAAGFTSYEYSKIQYSQRFKDIVAGYVGRLEKAKIGLGNKWIHEYKYLWVDEEFFGDFSDETIALFKEKHKEDALMMQPNDNGSYYVILLTDGDLDSKFFQDNKRAI